MATQKQIAANRTNAQRSTGPRTDEGKATSRLNAVRHGILARTPVVPNLERAEDWESHRRGFLDSLHPVGRLEEMLAERAIQLAWRIGRVAEYERDEVAKFYSEDAPRLWREMEELGVAGGRQLPDLSKLGVLTRYEAHLQRSLTQMLRELERYQAKRRAEGAVVPNGAEITPTGDPTVRPGVDGNTADAGSAGEMSTAERTIAATSDLGLGRGGKDAAMGAPESTMRVVSP